jgi:hypothetical protein
MIAVIKIAEYPVTAGPDVLDVPKDVWGLFLSAGFPLRRA